MEGTHTEHCRSWPETTEAIRSSESVDEVELSGGVPDEVQNESQVQQHLQPQQPNVLEVELSGVPDEDQNESHHLQPQQPDVSEIKLSGGVSDEDKNTLHLQPQQPIVSELELSGGVPNEDLKELHLHSQQLNVSEVELSGGVPDEVELLGGVLDEDHNESLVHQHLQPQQPNVLENLELSQNSVEFIGFPHSQDHYELAVEDESVLSDASELLGEGSVWETGDTAEDYLVKDLGFASRHHPPVEFQTNGLEDTDSEQRDEDMEAEAAEAQYIPTINEEALMQKLVALERRREKELDILVERLVEEQQARAQDKTKYKSMLASFCQEKDLLLEDVEILQTSLAVEEAEHYDDSLKNNQIISGLKRQNNDIIDENDWLKEEVKRLKGNVGEQQTTIENIVAKSKQLSNAMKKIKQELQEKLNVIQNQDSWCSELECEMRQLEASRQSAESKWEAKVSELQDQLQARQDIHQTTLDFLLLEAVRSGHLGLVTELLGAGASTEVVTTHNNSGQRALHVAAEEGHRKVTEALLRARAHHTAQDSHGNQPIHVATRHDHDEVVEVLLSHDPQVATAPDRQGWTIVQLAVSLGHLGVLQTLARHQKDLLTTRTQHGHTLLHFSIANNQLRMSEWLLSNTKLGLRDVVVGGKGSLVYSLLLHVLLARCLVVAGWFHLGGMVWRIVTCWPLKNLGMGLYNWLKLRQEAPLIKEYTSLRISPTTTTTTVLPGSEAYNSVPVSGTTRHQIQVRVME